MIDRKAVEKLENLDNDSLSELLETIVAGEMSCLERSVIRNIVEECFRRNDSEVTWFALEIVENRTDVFVTDLLVDAAQKEQEWSVAIFLIEQLLERSDGLDPDIFLQFFSLADGDIVRETAARALLIIGEVGAFAKVQAIFDAENDILVRLNLAGVLFLMSRDQKFFSFIQKRYNDLSLEVAKEARECGKLIQEHLS